MSGYYRNGQYYRSGEEFAHKDFATLVREAEQLHADIRQIKISVETRHQSSWWVPGGETLDIMDNHVYEPGHYEDGDVTYTYADHTSLNRSYVTFNACMSELCDRFVDKAKSLDLRFHKSNSTKDAGPSLLISYAGGDQLRKLVTLPASGDLAHDLFASAPPVIANVGEERVLVSQKEDSSGIESFRYQPISPKQAALDLQPLIQEASILSKLIEKVKDVKIQTSGGFDSHLHVYAYDDKDGAPRAKNLTELLNSVRGEMTALTPDKKLECTYDVIGNVSGIKPMRNQAALINRVGALLDGLGLGVAA